MQSSAGAAASQLSLRDIYNLLLDREVARSLHQFAEGDRIRDYLSRFGVSIDDETRRCRSRDGRRGRRPNADDLRWDAAAAQEPVLRADRIAAALVAAATEGDWTTDRFVWNLLRDRELARRAYNYREADRIRSYLQELGFQVATKPARGARLTGAPVSALTPSTITGGVLGATLLGASYPLRRRWCRGRRNLRGHHP
jgi:cysteinyl-tRNA synthetase